MIVTIEYGMSNMPETLENVYFISQDISVRGDAVVISYYDKFGHMQKRKIRYTDYVTITIH